MTILLDTLENINNNAFAWWIENFGLNYVSVDQDGEVCTISDLDIPCIAELDAEALKVIVKA